jgi:O-antigen/teichoic acid export membrane protein
MIKINSLKDKGLKEIALKSGSYFLLRLFGFVFSFAFALITTRKYGASVYGYVTLAFSIMMVLSVFCRLGFDINLTRLIAQNKFKDKTGLYTKSIFITFSIGLFFSFLIFCNATFISNAIFKKPDFVIYLKWISFSIPIWAVILINAGVFRGYKFNVLYSVFNSFGRFLLTSLLLVLIYFFGEYYQYAPIVAHFFGLLILSIVSFFFIVKTLGTINFKSTISFKSYFNTSFPMFLSTSIMILLAWVDKIFLGYFVIGENIGMYDISLRIAALIGFTLEAINSILTPKISESFAKNDFKQMQKEITFSAKINFYLSIAVFLFIILFSGYILEFFSESFVDGQTVLFICCIGQLINAFSGPVGNILQMTGLQKTFTKIIAVAFIINIILNPILIKMYGINGAALAMVISMIFWNFTSSYFVYKKLGIRSYYLPFIS